jgi:hypothetical protein
LAEDAKKRTIATLSTRFPKERKGKAVIWSRQAEGSKRLKANLQ